MAHQTKTYPADGVVEKALSMFKDNHEFLFRLSSAYGKPVSRQTLQGWRNRCAFSRTIIPYVHRVTRIGLVELITAESRAMLKEMEEEESQQHSVAMQ